MLNFVRILLLILCSCTPFLFATEASVVDKKQAKIAITQIIKHPSLDLIAQGVIAELKENGYDEANISQDNAQGDIPTAVQIAQKIASESPDIVIAISTPSAQTMQKVLQGTKTALVFGAVTDPLGAKLVKNLEKPEGFITGTVDLPSPEDQVKLMQEMVPSLKTVGLIYNPSEPNSVFQLNQLKKVLEQKGLKFVEAPASKTSTVQTAATYLSDKVEAMFIPNDNTVASALQSLLRVAMEARIPLFASDPESVKEGALAGLANDQEKVGRETGKIVVRILNGEAPGSISVETVKISKVYINKETRKKLGL